ncbi:MAG TPA: hypothetical protein VM580_17255 [Labilithrix sp.]|nr:hypothetical protein [Labilithrix sp.]
MGAGAFAVGATVTGLLSLDANSDLKALRNKLGVTRAELNDQESKLQTLGIATDVLIGAAVITAGVTLYLTLTSSSRAEASKTAGKVAKQVGFTSRGMVLGGTF